MTQRILFSVSAIIMLIAVVAIIVTNKPKVSNKLVSLKYENNYLYSENKKINVLIFSNTKKHKVHFKENIDSIYLINVDQTQRFELELIDIEYSHEETFLGDQFYGYTYSFKMPRLESNLLIEDANLEINLVNNDNYKLAIGSFKFLYYQDVGNEYFLRINGLYGYKQDNSEYARLYKVIIEYENDQEFLIEHISIDGSENLEFEIKDTQIEVYIPYKPLGLNQVPLILTISSLGITKNQIIDNFIFFNDFNIFQYSGDLANIYEAN